jgi:hypothetical protein
VERPNYQANDVVGLGGSGTCGIVGLRTPWEERQLPDDKAADMPQTITTTSSGSASLSLCSPEIKAELLNFFSHSDAPYAMKRKPKEWAKLQVQLKRLKLAGPLEATRR